MNYLLNQLSEDYYFIAFISLLSVVILVSPISSVAIFFVVIVGLSLLIMGIYNPEILIYLLILSVTNIFGTIDILEEYRIPGIGKPSDFILLLLMILSVYHIVKHKRIKEVFKIPNNRLFAIIIIYFIFLIFYSSVITNRNSFDYALRVGAMYLYYLSFLFPFIFLNTPKKFNNFLYFLRLGSIVTGTTSIISNIVGYSIVSGSVPGEYGNYIRLYNPLHFNYFIVVLGIFQFVINYKGVNRIRLLEIIIGAMGVFLFFGRTSIIATIIMIALILSFLGNKKIVKYYYGAIILGIVILILGFSSSVLFQRFQEGIIGTMQGEESLNYRLLGILYGWGIFTQMPFFGTGFIRKDTNFYYGLLTPDGYISTNNADFGHFSILYTTGAVGYCLITYFIIKSLIKLKSGLNYYNKIVLNSIYVQFSMAVFVFIIINYFFLQLAGNFYGSRWVAIDLTMLAVSLNVLNSDSNIFIQKLT